MVYLKKATIEDYDFYFKIKCNRDNMFWSGHEKKPEYNKMFVFYREILEQQNLKFNRKIFIVENNDEKCGYLYIDPINMDSIEISVAIIDFFSGNGIGGKALQEAEKYIKKENFKFMVANVREDNSKSQRMFLKQGYVASDNYSYTKIENMNKNVKMIEFIKILGK